MYAIDNGHKYQLADGQEIRFIKKEKDPITNEFKTVWVGTTNEELLEVLIDRTTNLNAKMTSPENIVAIHLMKKALTVFNARTAARVLQNVEATPEAHESAQHIIDEAAAIMRQTQERSMIQLEVEDMNLMEAAEYLTGTGVMEKIHGLPSSLIGSHDASHTTVGINDTDRAVVFQPLSQLVGTEVPPVTTTVWPFPDNRGVIDKVADDVSGNAQTYGDTKDEDPVK